MLTRLKKQARKLFVAGVLVTALLTPIVVAKADLYIVATDNGSYIGLSCGSSAGNFRYIYYAPTNTYYFYDAYPDDCP